jgi:hypothetical protein
MVPSAQQYRVKKIHHPKTQFRLPQRICGKSYSHPCSVWSILQRQGLWTWSISNGPFVPQFTNRTI